MFPCSKSKARKGGPMSENLVLDSTPLSALDRCDRCGAQAYLRAVMANGFELLFCGHHAKKYQDGLANAASRIQDETERITEESAAK
jgi:hypothetical protein